MEGLTVGRMVHAVEPETVERLKVERTFGPSEWVKEPNPKVGQHRAAVVAGVEDAEAGVVTLFIFHPDQAPELRTGVPYSEVYAGGEAAPGTWHSIEQP